LLNERVCWVLFDRVLRFVEWQDLVTDDHFSVDGTLIKAWASQKSVVRADGTLPPPEIGGRNPTVNFRGEQRSNDTHVSRTDPEARSYCKSVGEFARPFICAMR
jgi:hypothetical protein